MATKAIRFDLEAYSRLKQAKAKGESFSQAIKRLVKPPIDVDAWLKSIRGNPLNNEAVEAVDLAVSRRNQASRRRTRAE